MQYSIIITTAITLALTGQLVSAGDIIDNYNTGDTLKFKLRKLLKNNIIPGNSPKIFVVPK